VESDKNNLAQSNKKMSVRALLFRKIGRLWLV